MENATQPVTVVVDGQKGLQAYVDISNITTKFPKVNHFTYHVEDDVMILDLQDTSKDNPKSKRLTIKGVSRNKDVKNIVRLKFEIALDKDCCD